MAKNPRNSNHCWEALRVASLRTQMSERLRYKTEGISHNTQSFRQASRMSPYSEEHRIPPSGAFELAIYCQLSYSASLFT
jgi:hypothetical protein